MNDLSVSSSGSAKNEFSQAMDRVGEIIASLDANMSALEGHADRICGSSPQETDGPVPDHQNSYCGKVYGKCDDLDALNSRVANLARRFSAF